MIESLQPVDWVIIALMATSAVFGAIRGFSGTLAFFVAVVAAAALGVWIWPQSAGWFGELYRRLPVCGGAVLIVFALVRVVVKKLVSGLLTQPSDAIFGLLIGALMVLALVALWAFLGIHLEYSQLAEYLAKYVGG